MYRQLFLLRRINAFFLVAFVLSFIFACGPQSTFDTVGDVAELQKNLLIFVFIIAAVVFVLVEGLIIFISVRYRRRKADDTLPKQTEGNQRLEILWTIIPFIILVVIAIPTVRAIWDLADDPCDDVSCLEVEAVGHRWWFEFRYPTKEVITSSELVLPINTPISVDLFSQDVIHSFWVPRIAGKVDMVPTKQNELFFEIKEEGIFEGQCAEFCSGEHAKMKFRVRAVSEIEFDNWVESWFTPPPDSVATMPGATLFAANCSVCHTVNSYRLGGYGIEVVDQEKKWSDLITACKDGLTSECGTTVGRVSAPNLTHFAQRTTIASGWKELTRDSLVSWIKDPSSLKTGTYMQSFASVYNTDDKSANLTDQEIADIADYLLALVPAESGEERSVLQP